VTPVTFINFSKLFYRPFADGLIFGENPQFFRLFGRPWKNRTETVLKHKTRNREIREKQTPSKKDAVFFALARANKRHTESRHEHIEGRNMTRPDIKMFNTIIVSDGNADPRLAAVLPLSSLKPNAPHRRAATAATR
jgi:hypothetical protein